jgi:hypothetical protein
VSASRPPVGAWLARLLDAQPWARDWFGRTIDQIESTPSGFDDSRFHSAFAGAARHLGKQRVAFDVRSNDRARVRADCPAGIERWAVDELGRVALLLYAFEKLLADRASALLEGCYAQGDLRERQATLRALPHLPCPERFLALAIDACRTNVQTIFEAIACENPFPARYFPDLNFNQMVLKAMFNGVALARVEGLHRRRGAELARMAADYAAERRAAGRSVPPDIGLIDSNGPQHGVGR